MLRGVAGVAESDKEERTHRPVGTWVQRLRRASRTRVVQPCGTSIVDLFLQHVFLTSRLPSELSQAP